MMAEQVNIDRIIMQVMDNVTQVVEEQERLNEVKQILYMCLSRFQIFEEETALSVDVDRTVEYLKQYLLQMKLDGCTDGSIKGYKNNIKNMLNYINKNVTEITYQDLKGYMAYGKLVRKWKDRTYNSQLISIRSFFSFLYAEDMLPDNPAKKLKETKVEYRIGPTLQPEQREMVRCACADELELAICDMLYVTGIRVSELCGMNQSDVDFNRKTAIVYGKGRKERQVCLNGQVALHLWRYLQSRNDDNPALFVSPHGQCRRIGAQTVRNILKRIKERDEELADVRVTPHVFRRTVGTDMINKGAPAEIVKEVLGHVKIDTTLKCYAAISKDTVRQAHARFVG